MKRIKTILSVTLLASLLPSALFAQDFPSGNNTFPNGTWSRDTIIHNVDPWTGTGPHSPSRSAITAIYSNGHILLFSSSEGMLAYCIQNIDSSIIMREQIYVSSSSPYIVNITNLPSGHFCLLLYINNECLEGEFYKE